MSYGDRYRAMVLLTCVVVLAAVWPGVSLERFVDGNRPWLLMLPGAVAGAAWLLRLGFAPDEGQRTVGADVGLDVGAASGLLLVGGYAMSLTSVLRGVATDAGVWFVPIFLVVLWFVGYLAGNVVWILVAGALWVVASGRAARPEGGPRRWADLVIAAYLGLLALTVVLLFAMPTQASESDAVAGLGARFSTIFTADTGQFTGGQALLVWTARVVLVGVLVLGLIGYFSRSRLTGDPDGGPPAVVRDELAQDPPFDKAAQAFLDRPDAP